MEAVRDQAIPVYVLSLPGDTHRRSGIEAQLTALGITAQFVEGIDPVTISDKELRGFRSLVSWLRVGRRMSRAEAACTRAHFDILERFVQSGERFALVLEDDVVLSPEVPQLLTSTLWLDEDVIYLGHSSKRGKIGSPAKRISEDLYTFQVCDPPLGGFARIISRNFALLRLAERPTLVVPHDVLVLSDLSIRVFLLNRDVASHPPAVRGQSRIRSHPEHLNGSMLQWHGLSNPLWKRLGWRCWRIVNRVTVMLGRTTQGRRALRFASRFI